MTSCWPHEHHQRTLSTWRISKRKSRVSTSLRHDMCMDVAVYIPGGRTSINNLLRAQRRQQMQAITEMTDIMDVLHTNNNGNFLMSVQFFSEKLDTAIMEGLASINWGTRYMDWWCQRWMSAFYNQLPQKTCISICKRSKKKSPRMNGLNLKSYPTMWEYIKEEALFGVQFTVHREKFL